MHFTEKVTEIALGHFRQTWNQNPGLYNRAKAFPHSLLKVICQIRCVSKSSFPLMQGGSLSAFSSGLHTEIYYSAMGCQEIWFFKSNSSGSCFSYPEVPLSVPTDDSDRSGVTCNLLLVITICSQSQGEKPKFLMFSVLLWSHKTGKICVVSPCVGWVTERIILC